MQELGSFSLFNNKMNKISKYSRISVVGGWLIDSAPLLHVDVAFAVDADDAHADTYTDYCCYCSHRTASLNSLL